MKVKKKIKVILIVFNLNNIQLDNKACLNYLSNELVCSNCLEVCPINAISLKNKLPEIDHTFCKNCGACVSSCDTLAIDHIQKPYITTSKHIAEYPNSIITCDNFEEYQKGIKIPCYLYLDVWLILQHSNGGDTFNLYIEKCNNCNKASYFSIKNHACKLQKELEELDIPLAIKLIEKLNHKSDTQTVNGLSRREFLQKLSPKNLKEQIFIKESEPKPDKNLKLNRARYKRQLYNNYFEKHLDVSKRKQVKLPYKKFNMLELSDTCNGCNICTGICPTAAIRWQDNLNESNLIFSVQDCIGCKKCLICLEESIKLTEINIGDYQNHKIKKLKSFTVKSCKECGDQFKTNKEQELCTYCLLKLDKEPLRFFI